jgi:hypothetical protein
LFVILHLWIWCDSFIHENLFQENKRGGPYDYSQEPVLSADVGGTNILLGSWIWPAIIAVFLGVLLLLQSFSAEQEIAVLSWTEVGNLSVVFAALRRPGLPAMLS